jgi:hypothetical protein
MRKIFKYLGLTLLALLVVAGALLAYFWEELSTFPGMPAAYEAKELCSCLYVEGRPEEECELFIRQNVVPIQERSYDREGKAVRVRALWTERQARYLGPKHGCVLSPEAP